MSFRFSLGSLLALACVSGGHPAAAAPYYEGKTITLIVGLSPGGSTDVFVRSFAEVLERHIPGHPEIVVQNMPGNGGVKAANYVFEVAKPDGLRLYWGNWSPIGQIIGDENLHAKYDQFEFIGAVDDTRLVYARTDTIPGGLKKPADIVRADDPNLGGIAPTTTPDILVRLSLDLLGVRYNYVPGYGGGSESYAAMLGKELQISTTSLVSYRGRSADFVQSGEGTALYYLVPTDADGKFTPNPYITGMPAFPDLYREIHGKAPAGPDWEALNWLVRLAGQITIVGLAPPGTDPAALADLRTGYEAAAKDVAFSEQATKALGHPYTFVMPEEGEAIIRSLVDTPPSVTSAIKKLLEGFKQ